MRFSLLFILHIIIPCMGRGVCSLVNRMHDFVRSQEQIRVKGPFYHHRWLFFDSNPRLAAACKSCILTIKPLLLPVGKIIIFSSFILGWVWLGLHVIASGKAISLHFSRIRLLQVSPPGWLSSSIPGLPAQCFTMNTGYSQIARYANPAQACDFTGNCTALRPEVVKVCLVSYPVVHL